MYLHTQPDYKTKPNPTREKPHLPQKEESKDFEAKKGGHLEVTAVSGIPAEGRA